VADFPGLESFNGDDLIMSATSYYLGRQTISVDLHCMCIVRAWPRLNRGVQEYIRRIVDEAFRRDSLLSKSDQNVSHLGAACDKQSWEKVRACWLETEAVK
jgi:hypothetical protein